MTSQIRTKGLKKTALSIALGMCLVSSVALAQSTSGGIVGAVAPGSTVTISNNSGVTRTVTADANGRYTATNLPVGEYKVVAGGVERKVTVIVGSNANVSFTGPVGSLGTVTVSASSGAQIDVTATDTRTIITAEELRRLPIARSAEAIALLSPGAVVGNGRFFGGDISFGGSSVAENAYYLNGYFSGNPITNIGGFTLPYGSIEQQETYTGGYGAKYGRSSGGVISQIGKSGSNEWHFGGQVLFEPKSLKSVRPDRFLPDLSDQFPEGYEYANDTAGLAYDRGDDRKSWQNVYSGYVSGPIFQDRLFFFLSAEQTDGNRDVPSGNPEASFAANASKYESDQTKIYAKLNWNITDNHLLEYTYISDKYQEEGKTYAFDWDTYDYGEYLIPALANRSNTEFSILRYTGYLNDNLTLTVNYGTSRNRFSNDPYLTGLPQIVGSSSQNPSLNGGSPNTNVQASPRTAHNADQYTDGLRVELEWLWGDHTFNIGIDNTTLEGKNQGTSQLGPIFEYGKSASDKTNVSGGLGVGPTGIVPGACNGAPLIDGTGSVASGGNGVPVGGSSNCGYRVNKLVYFDTTSMKNEQNAFYLEDKWQVTDNLLLSLGVRADEYQNFSDTGTRFVDSGTQWQPRVGFAWDVNGDSSFKVFGNAGRYFLNMPNAVAIRGTSASTYTREYFTYTGIDENGIPTGLTPINRPSTGLPAGPVSSNGELGTPKDPLTYVPEDIKSQYQDEYVLGFEARLPQDWIFGAKITRRELKSAIDDFCDPYTLLDAAGLDHLAFDSTRASVTGRDADGKTYISSYCYMFNPGGENTYALQEVTKNPIISWDNVEGSYKRVKLASDEMGFGDLERTYNALDFFLERPWDGKWQARFDYTWSKSKGNSEGPANSDTGQGSNPHDNGVATSQNWDAWQIMSFANGYLPNDRRHQFKAHGAYAITPEWMISGNVMIASGAPISCFGYYDPDGTIAHDSAAADPIGYGDSYHSCFNEGFTPGKENLPWTHRLDLGASWKPAALDHKLAVTLNVFNVLNSRKVTSVYQYSEDDGPYSINEDFKLPTSFTTPRYVQVSVSYDY